MATFQDMPPPGGFGNIDVTRVVAKPLINRWVWAGLFGAWTIWGFYNYRLGSQIRRIRYAEKQEHFLAIEPFVLAEKDRRFLRELRIDREMERKLMKDHKNWEVGTLYGEPIYKTLPPGSLKYTLKEFLAHRPRSEYLEYFYEDCSLMRGKFCEKVES